MQAMPKRTETMFGSPDDARREHMKDAAAVKAKLVSPLGVAAVFSSYALATGLN